MSRSASGGGRPPGIGEYLFAELRQAFQDVRQKVIEEGWFGRVVTAAPVIEQGHEVQAAGEREGPVGRSASFDELWKPTNENIAGLNARNRAIEREKEKIPPSEHDMDFDR